MFYLLYIHSYDPLMLIKLACQRGSGSKFHTFKWMSSISKWTNCFSFSLSFCKRKKAIWQGIVKNAVVVSQRRQNNHLSRAAHRGKNSVVIIYSSSTSQPHQHLSMTVAAQPVHEAVTALHRQNVVGVSHFRSWILPGLHLKPTTSLPNKQQATSVAQIWRMQLSHNLAIKQHYNYW